MDLGEVRPGNAIGESVISYDSIPWRGAKARGKSESFGPRPDLILSDPKLPVWTGLRFLGLSALLTEASEREGTRIVRKGLGGQGIRLTELSCWKR